MPMVPLPFFLPPVLPSFLPSFLPPQSSVVGIDTLPGWKKGTIGIHSDDGKVKEGREGKGRERGGERGGGGGGEREGERKEREREREKSTGKKAQKGGRRKVGKESN